MAADTDTAYVSATAAAPQSAVMDAATTHPIASFALTGGVLNREGVLYMPLNETMSVMGAAVTADPDNQSNKIRLDLTDGSAYQLTLTTENGVTSVATAGASAQIVNQNGVDYVPMSFIQALTNRVVSVYNNSLLLITVSDTPCWKTLDAYSVDKTSNADGAIGMALGLQGVPYVWGGTSPAGFDCSGFVQYVYAANGVSLPRVASAQQAATVPVSLNSLQAGDLVFWGYPAYHVGIYIGNGCYIHAPAPGQCVKIQTLSSYCPTSGGRIA